MSTPIDLNADLGEGFGVWRLGDDDALLDIVTSANVACGFHAGDPVTMRRVCARAAAAGVAVGAQVSYRDLAGFGRRFIDVEPAELAADVLYQLAALDGIARAAGTRVSYVKPHGALYNAAVAHQGHAQAVIDAVLAYDRRLPVLGLPGSALLREAEAAGMRPVPEGFADRGLHPGRHAGAPHASPAPWCTTRRWWPNGRCAWRPTASWWRWTARALLMPVAVGLRPRRHPGRGRHSPARCGRRWPTRASSCGRSAAESQSAESDAGCRSYGRRRPDSRSAATSSTVRPAP